MLRKHAGFASKMVAATPLNKKVDIVTKRDRRVHTAAYNDGTSHITELPLTELHYGPVKLDE